VSRAETFTNWDLLSNLFETFARYAFSMPFDISPVNDRALRGSTAYHDGLAAESNVEIQFQSEGYTLLERRWRGKAGEIDLIFRDNNTNLWGQTGGFVFVEVKKAKSHATAAERLSQRQLDRICRAGEEYVALSSPGQTVDMRVDLALVDGQGQIEILPNISQY